MGFKKGCNMEIKIELLENQKLMAKFDAFSILSDQPAENHGENSAPSPFDYFLASTAMCAGYFTKAYCRPRNISTEGIEIKQTTTRNPENKYQIHFKIEVKFPEHINTKDREGILRSIEGCTVKKAIMNSPTFEIAAN